MARASAGHHVAFSRDRKLRFPLLSDFEPKGDVAKTYGVYRNHDGFSERALCVLDEEGTTVARGTPLAEIFPARQLVESRFSATKGKNGRSKDLRYASNQWLA